MIVGSGTALRVVKTLIDWLPRGDVTNSPNMRKQLFGVPVYRAQVVHCCRLLFFSFLGLRHGYVMTVGFGDPGVCDKVTGVSWRLVECTMIAFGLRDVEGHAAPSSAPAHFFASSTRVIFSKYMVNSARGNLCRRLKHVT